MPINCHLSAVAMELGGAAALAPSDEGAGQKSLIFARGREKTVVFACFFVFLSLSQIA